MSAAPALEFVFEIRAQIGAVQRAGPAAFGERQHIPIIGGTVSGPRLNGRILPGGSDWPLTRADGTSLIEAHYSVQANDGTLIYVHNRGLRVSSAEVLERLRRGEAVPANNLYFRSAPVFDAPDGAHGWLTRHLFVATLERSVDGVNIRVFVLGQRAPQTSDPLLKSSRESNGGSDGQDKARIFGRRRTPRQGRLLHTGS